MHIVTKTRIIDQQAAIDTVCDHCGGIFDLNDGVVDMSGNILCSECTYTDHEPTPVIKNVDFKREYQGKVADQTRNNRRPNH